MQPCISIIGGTGNFGQFWKGYFEKKGCEVLIVSRSTALSPLEAIQKGEIIIFCVSIRNTWTVLEEHVPHIPDGKLILDMTGLKQKALERMHPYASRGEVVGTHPMFGPWIKELRDENIIYDSISGGEYWRWLFSLWKKDGANLIALEAKKHDELIGILQAMTHFVSLLFGNIMKRKGVHPDDILHLGTPIYRMQTFILGRFLNQSPGLYADMQIENDVYKHEVLPLFQELCAHLGAIIYNNEYKSFEKEFLDLREFFGEKFLHKAVEKTQEVDDVLKHEK